VSELTLDLRDDPVDDLRPKSTVLAVAPLDLRDPVDELPPLDLRGPVDELPEVDILPLPARTICGEQLLEYTRECYLYE
jgi:hypothetical protein